MTINSQSDKATALPSQTTETSLTSLAVRSENTGQRKRPKEHSEQPQWEQ